LPRGFNIPSTVDNGRLTPFLTIFLTPSVGGGIDIEPSTTLGAGVLDLDSKTFSPGDDVVATSVFDVVDEGAFDSGTFLVGVVDGSLARNLGERRSVMILLLIAFFGFAVAGEGFVVKPIFNFFVRAAKASMWCEDDSVRWIQILQASALVGLGLSISDTKACMKCKAMMVCRPDVVMIRGWDL
jgi:hypothetical protein